VPKEKTPEGPNGGGDGGGDDNDGGDGGGDDNGGGDDDRDDSGDDGRGDGNDDPFGLYPMCCAACRHSIADLSTSVDECLQAMEAMK
jgi:hypothetical protein